MKKIVPIMLSCSMLFSSAMIQPVSYAEGGIVAGLQSSGDYLLGDFSDSVTATAWADTSVTTADKYDPSFKGLSLGWVQSDSSGSYLNTYKSDVFADLNFADYDNFELSFNLGKNADTGVTALGNYLTIVLSTAESLTDYGSYKKDECLIYELPLSSYALNQKVSASIPLSAFVTQFDGMAGGVQGTADGTTSLADIKSIGFFGGHAGFFGAKGTAAQPDGWTWLFKNSGQKENMSCGFILYNMSLTNDVDAKTDLDNHMAQYTTVSDDIELPTTLDGFDGTISWESNNAAIAVDGTVTKQDADTNVTLTATITNADGTSETVTYNVTVAAKIKLAAGLQLDGSFLIGDFTDAKTATAWADTSVTTVDKYDTVLKGLSLGWVQTDSSGSYLDTYNKDVFSDLNFADYENFELSFNLGKNADTGVTSLGNYLTIVLSTADELTDYGSYKKNECLIYELPLSDYALNETVTASIPLSTFVTQFDGMAGGVQGAADGTTSLADIKSIGLFGGYAGFFGAKGTAAAPAGWTWLFKNSGQKENMSCGFMLYDMSLTSDNIDAKAVLDAYMTKYAEVEENIILPTTLEGFSGTIDWSSDNTDIIKNNGTVIRPAEDTAVTLIAAIMYPDGSVQVASYEVNVKARVVLKAGLQADGSYLIGDFTDVTTATAWADTSAAVEDKYDPVFKALTLNWVQTGSFGSYLSKYKNDIFSDLDFTAYENLNLSFYINENNDRTINNYLTIILSTAESITDYGKFKNDECLVYEIPLSGYAVNEKVSVSIPLSDFVTQFDGKVNGVQGTADGITNLADIKSIGLFGAHAGAFGATGTAAAPAGWTWLFKNSNQNNGMSCGFLLHDISLNNEEEITGFNLHKADGSVLTSLDEAATVYGKVKTDDVAEGESVNVFIAVYNGNRLEKCEMDTVTVVNGEITTPEIAVDPVSHNKVTAFIWDTTYEPIMNVATVSK